MPLLGFTPDAPRTTPGIIADCERFIPYESGMEGAPAANSTGVSAFAAAAVGGVSWQKLDGTTRTFVGLPAALIEYGSPHTDRSASAYATVAAWTFAPFGDRIVAAGYPNTLQSSTTGAFSAISGAPIAKVVFSVITSGGGFVIAANTSVNADQWRCCAANDATDWTVSIATQANQGRLLGNDAGAINAGMEFGDAALLFKSRTMFVGRYVGGEFTFQFAEVAGGAGCVGPHALCSVDTGVLFVGPDNIWIFDGARPVPIGDGQIRQWFYNNLSTTHKAQVRAIFDRPRNRVHIMFPNTASTGFCNESIVYHLVTKQWGRGSLSGSHAFMFTNPGATIDSVSGTIDSYSSLIDGEEWSPTSRSIGYISNATPFTFYTLTGASQSSSFISEDVGDPVRESHLTEVRLVYQTIPTTASCGGYVLDEAGDTADLIGARTSYDEPSDTLNKFDLRQCARFHRLSFNFTGPVKVIDKRIKLTPAGAR